MGAVNVALREQFIRDGFVLFKGVLEPELVERASTAFRLPGMRRMALEKRVFSRGRRAGSRS